MPHKLSSVSFFCPAYHDEKNLPILIPRAREFLREITDTFEIIIVEDGSPDRTGVVADELAAQFPEVRVIHHAKNQGYGATIRDGFLNATFDYVCYTDGDNQYNIHEMKAAIPLLEKADIASGYVDTKAADARRKLQSKVFNLVITFLFWVRIRDINCAMKIYSRKALKKIDIKSKSAFIDAEMLIKARRAGCTIAQFPVTHFPRTEGLASGSKWSVIKPTIIDMLKFRFGLL